MQRVRRRAIDGGRRTVMTLGRVRADGVRGPPLNLVSGRRDDQQSGHFEQFAPGEMHGRIIDPMDLDPTWLLISLIPSGIGFVLFVYGKKQQRWPHMFAGIAFSVYPYFTSSITMMVGVGVALAVALWVAVRGGW